MHAAAKSGAPVICLYVLDDAAGRAPGGAARWWLAQSLRALGADIAARGGFLALRKGPAARVIPEVAREAGHAKASERIRRDYREEWLRTFDDLQTQDVPQIDTLKFDKDRWKIAEGRKSLSDLQIESAADPVAEQVMKALSSTTVPVDFEEAELQSVIDYLSAQTKVNFQLSALAASDIEDTVSQLRGKGVRFLSDIVTVDVKPDEHYSDGKAIKFQDPDGIILELQQPPRPGVKT